MKNHRQSSNEWIIMIIIISDRRLDFLIVHNKKENWLKLLNSSERIFGTYKLNVLTWLGLLLLCMIFYLCSYSDFFSSNLFNYRFPYCIQLYSWSTRQVIAAQHMCWFLKASNPTMFSPINYFNFIPQVQMVSLFLPFMVCHTRLFNLTSYYCLPMFF